MTLQIEKPAYGGREPQPDAPRTTPLIAAVITVGMVVLALVVFLLARGESRGLGAVDETTSSTAASTTATVASSSVSVQPTTASSATTATAPTSSSSAVTTPTTAGSTATSSPSLPPAQAPAGAMWPDPAASTRFASPEAAARSFAIDVAGFRDPAVGSYVGDSSGAVDVRPGVDGPSTTVHLRNSTADNTWWVVGATTGEIQLERPKGGETVAESIRLVGAARAFEGVVEVSVRSLNGRVSLVDGFVTGRGDGELGQFDDTFAIAGGYAGPAVLLLTSPSGDDGSTLAATALRLDIG